MKQFIYPDRGHGPTPRPTLTVAELIAALQSYPPEMPVIAVSEGMYGHLDPQEFTVLPASDDLIEDTLDLTGD